MSFFKTSDNQNIESAKEFELGATVFPDGTECEAYVTSIEWREPKNEFEGDPSVSVEWTIVSPAIYSKKKIVQNLKICDKDDKKKDNAIRMLAAIYTINGKVNIADVKTKPTNADLSGAALSTKAVIKIGLITTKKQDADGNDVVYKNNFVKAVSAKNKVSSSNTHSTKDADGDDIGF